MTGNYFTEKQFRAVIMTAQLAAVISRKEELANEDGDLNLEFYKDKESKLKRITIFTLVKKINCCKINYYEQQILKQYSNKALSIFRYYYNNT